MLTDGQAAHALQVYEVECIKELRLQYAAFSEEQRAALPVFDELWSDFRIRFCPVGKERELSNKQCRLMPDVIAPHLGVRHQFGYVRGAGGEGIAHGQNSTGGYSSRRICADQAASDSGTALFFPPLNKQRGAEVSFHFCVERCHKRVAFTVCSSRLHLRSVRRLCII